MGWITNVTFLADLCINDTKIRAGMTTQVRWDLGIGGFDIDGTGKIVNAYHLFPLGDNRDSPEGKAYAAGLENWTGYIDTNMAVLFFNKGQLIDLDISASNYVGAHFVNNDMKAVHVVENKTIYYPMTEEQGEIFLQDLAKFRARIENTDPAGDDFDGLCQAFIGRPKEIIDEFYEEKQSNG